MTILAAGFEQSLREEEDGIIKGEGGFQFPTHGRSGNAGNYRGGAAPSKPEQHKKKEEPEVSPERLAAEYGVTKIKDLTEGKDRSSTIILGVNQLDDDAICDTLEKYPTYKRDRKIVEDVRNGAVESTQTINPGNNAASTPSFSDNETNIHTKCVLRLLPAAWRTHF